MRIFRPLVTAGLAAGLGLLGAGCRVEGCLDQRDDCRMPSPCAALSVTCDNGDLELRVLEPGAARPGGFHALGGDGDVLIGNDRVVAVISAPGNQNYLDISGGVLLDLASRGADNDAISEILTVTGILPEDAAEYTDFTLIDERPARVAVQLRGHLFRRPDRPINTLYEVRPCEPGVRVRTEVYNGSPDTQLWTLSDGYYWSSRNMAPFVPGDGRGFSHGSWDLFTVDDAFESGPFLAGSTHNDTATSYAGMACSTNAITGFHSTVVSGGGLPKTVVSARGHQVFERFIATAPSPDVAGAADEIFTLREQLFGEPSARLFGRVEGASGSERHASLVVVQRRGLERIPWTQVVPRIDGSFSARIPASGELVVEVHSLGRLVAEIPVPGTSGDRDLGSISLPPGTFRSVSVAAHDPGGAPLEAEVYVVPADDATEQLVSGSLFGHFGACAPWLGPPQGASPACNRVLVSRAGPTSFTVPPGLYDLYAYHGPFHTIARATIDARTDTPAPVSFTLTALPLRPVGTVSADLHVHGAASFDSSLPDADRVLSFAAADVEVIIATDHDVAYDYSQTVQALGLQDRLTTVVGVETTGHVPYLRVPGDNFPRVVGHYNFWPIAYRPGTPRNGAPFDEFVEPAELFARFEPLYTADGIRQLNHPWAPNEFGRDLGFPRALGLDLTVPLPAEDDGTPAGLYVRRHGDIGNGDHHTQEVMNGSQNDLFLAYRAFWFYLLNQGILKVGTANSDSHGLTDNTVGAPRTVVYTPTTAGPTFDVGAFNGALKAGLCFGTNGPIIEATLVDGGEEKPYGIRLHRPAADAALRVIVSAAPWVIVDEIRIVVNGEVKRTISGDAIIKPADPFGSTELVRFGGLIPLADLLPPSGDAWIVVEAGAPLPLHADLGGGPTGGPDGIPDTGDNNGDGVVDARDVAEGEEVGPLNNATAPPRTDPRYHFFQVVPGGTPLAFTNPFLLDRDGNGHFDGPGVRR